jgi:carboxylate-amine ligase
MDPQATAVSWAAWQPSTPYSVGIEEEVMLLDPETWSLMPQANRLLASLSEDLVGHCCAETHASAVELTTSPHATVGEAVAELDRLRARLADDARRLGLAVGVAGMHPSGVDGDVEVSLRGRYELIHETMRGLARREPTFALHVHVGVPDAESAIRLLDRLRAHAPVLLALSASSPLWRGRATGLASNRAIMFQAFPRTGLPRHFDDYGDWVRTVDLLLRSGAIPEPTFLWWDVRPQPRLGTVEVRIMDAQPRPAATAALAAFVQALSRLELEEGFAASKLMNAQEVLAENRFLAARDGAAAALIDPVLVRRVPISDVVADLVTAAMPHALALGAADELASVSSLVASPEASRQVSLAERCGIRELVSDLARRFAPSMAARR